MRSESGPSPLTPFLPSGYRDPRGKGEHARDIYLSKLAPSTWEAGTYWDIQASKLPSPRGGGAGGEVSPPIRYGPDKSARR